MAKPDNSVRMCIDYRAVNKVTVVQRYPLPRIDDLLAKISKAKYITSLDLSKGYYQVKLDPETIPKTSFVTHCGKFEFVRLPFGLVNAPAFFQQQMDVVLQHTDSDGYIDDIVVHSETWEEHLHQLRATLQACREYELTLKLKKCCFGSAKLDFLGHSVGSGTLQPQTAKLQAILDYPLPKTQKNLKSFLGMLAYQKQYIPNFSITASPLFDQLKKGKPDLIHWTPTLQQTFEQLKDDLCKAPILMAPAMDQAFYLFTDACTTGVGAVLKQKHQDTLKPIGYFSKKLSPAEKNYSISELETLAVVKAVQHFAAYLHGSRFTVFTDHKALVHLPTMRNGNPRLVRWALVLQPFQYQVEYLPGKDNDEADTLSRAEWDWPSLHPHELQS